MQANSHLQHIHNKVDEIQTALLRFQHKNNQVSLHVRAKSNGSNVIDCVIADQADLKKLEAGRVSLIQKCDNNYLYISGELEKQALSNKKTLSIRILRACWFVLKSKGSVSWLQEKYIYDISPGAELELAS